jgi:hypothetical protein
MKKRVKAAAGGEGEKSINSSSFSSKMSILCLPPKAPPLAKIFSNLQGRF